jgi:hypothetical protein
MPGTAQVFHAYCACGGVELEGRGAPMVSLACYCDDCQAAGKLIEALPNGRSGMRADAGTVSVLFRKDRVRCVRGSELLVEHRLRPSSPGARLVAACCNCSMSARFDNWFPHVPLRTFSRNVELMKPEICIFTRYAPDATRILHDVPRHAGISPGFALKLAAATAYLALPWSLADEHGTTEQP